MFKKFLIVLSLLSITLLSGKEYSVQEQPLAFQEISKLEAKGTLRMSDKGLIYLDVSNDYIDLLKPILQVPGKISYRPTAKRSIGAHIPVFSEKEGIIPEELGRTFEFQITEIQSFTKRTSDGLTQLWSIAVDSPALETLRTNYGLSPTIKEHSFSIILGNQLPASPENWEQIDTLSPLNDSDEPTDEMEIKGSFTRISSKEIEEVASRINNVAQLILKNSGFSYLKVDDAFIEQIAPLIPAGKGFEPLPTGKKKMGAHISVFYEDEMISKKIWEPQEIGQWFTFTTKELRYVDRKNSTRTERIWFIAVDSPGLQRLRKIYGLKPKLNGHDFHITLGYENLNAPCR